MAGITPDQTRVVDPFASYGSNVVNKISQIVTHDSEGMLTVPSLQVVLNSVSPTTTVDVKPGYVIKEDVLIRITADHSVDFTDNNNWIDPPAFGFTGGYSYLVLKYEYAKSRPAPQATIRILQPDDRSDLATDSTLLLLKVVRVDSSQNIISLHDYDPTPGLNQNARQYIKYYAGGVVNLPTYSQTRDQGRVAYETKRNKFFFGYSDGWNELTAGGVVVSANTDTTGVFVGQLCYIDAAGQAQPSISTSINTSADLIITAIGLEADETGAGIVCGHAESVPVETGVTVAVGDMLYLSETESGTVTNVKPLTIYQMLGRALTAGNSSTPIEMIFTPKIPIASSVSGTITTWAPTGTGLYYHDIDVTALDGTSVFDCHWFNDATGKEVQPSDVEIVSGGAGIRVYFSTNTLTINFMIQSPTSIGSGGGGGGGGGSADHSNLLNLDFASSGHVGFAADPHNNTYHSETYITSASVTYETLNTNGDVGTGATQVAQGNHTHPTYIDVPTGEIILFESDVAVSGYTLLTDQDDQLVYVTKGSGAGGDAGGTLKSGGTWTQPGHNHSNSSAGNHSHTTGNFTLTNSHIPSHYHWMTSDHRWLEINNSTGPITNFFGGFTGGQNLVGLNKTDVTGGGAAHNHGSTSTTGSHSHTITSSATVNTWRPRGRNYTRQQRN